jgi:hypothetical protein
MTLLLSLITDDFVCHVSDRRLTNLTTGEEMVALASKTVVAPAGRMMASYTGLARITDRLTTEQWLAFTVFQARDSDDFFGAIAEASTDAFGRIRLPRRQKRHGFVISGWLPQQLGGRPFVAFVCNFLDFEAGCELAEPDVFTYRMRPLEAGGRFHIFSAGARLTAPEMADLDADVASALRSAGGHERAATLRLLRTIENVAGRDATVGGGAFICAIPRGFDVAAEQASDAPGLNVMGVHWGLPRPDVPTFAHIASARSETVESPVVVGDPFAGQMLLRVDQEHQPSLSGVPGLPAEGTVEMRLVALRDSTEMPASEQ